MRRADRDLARTVLAATDGEARLQGSSDSSEGAGSLLNVVVELQKRVNVESVVLVAKGDAPGRKSRSIRYASTLTFARDSTHRKRSF